MGGAGEVKLEKKKKVGERSRSRTSPGDCSELTGTSRSSGCWSGAAKGQVKVCAKLSTDHRCSLGVHSKVSVGGLGPQLAGGATAGKESGMQNREK